MYTDRCMYIVTYLGVERTCLSVGRPLCKSAKMLLKTNHRCLKTKESHMTHDT